MRSRLFGWSVSYEKSCHAIVGRMPKRCFVTAMNGRSPASLLSQTVTTQVGQLGTYKQSAFDAFSRDLNRFSVGLDERFEIPGKPLLKGV